MPSAVSFRVGEVTRYRLRFKLVKTKAIKERKEMSVIKVRVMVTKVSVIVIPHLEMVLPSTRLRCECFICISSCNSYNNSARQALVLI